VTVPSLNIYITCSRKPTSKHQLDHILRNSSIAQSVYWQRKGQNIISEFTWRLWEKCQSGMPKGWV